ncbi:MAG TPA: sulfotransferase [Candidatus Nanoarchaeia archaeon]|nr:sulfotransferase [Candidatus Nanoarchaeia archaeon]
MSNIEIDFAGIGAARSGTTWIAECLMEHPEIFFPYTKELNYFSKTRANNTKSEYEIRGINGYFELFKNSKGKKKGEFSTYYLYDPDASKIIKKYFPNIKLIVSLREPVSRAYSDWNNIKLSDLKEKEDFEQAFFRKKKENDLDNYMERGMYYKHLKVYFDLFPRKNIHVIIYEDINKNPEKVVKELYRFLGVNPNFKPKSLHEKVNPQQATKVKSLRYIINFLRKITLFLENVGLGKIISFIKRSTKINSFFESINKANKKKVKKEQMSSELFEKIRKVYEKDTKDLEKLINRKLTEWY